MLLSNPLTAIDAFIEGLLCLCTRFSVSAETFSSSERMRSVISSPVPEVRAVWAGVSLFLFLALVSLAGVARAQINAANDRCAKATELARHREQERNLAQQELLRRLEEERELAKEKMQFESQLAEYEKYASLAQLALGAAHEINNPLLGILSHLELEWRDASVEQRAEIDQCIEGTKRIANTLRRLLEYARPNPLLLSRVHLCRLVAETVQFLANQPLFRQIDMENLVPLDLLPIIADANQLSQILTNLLLNAAQATPPGGRITIFAHAVQAADQVELTVRDTGCGIPTDILPHVFEPFFTTKRGKGTGLGLSISQSYIRSHGGDIQVESVPGEGTRVRLMIPIRQTDNIVQSEEVVA